MMRVFISSTPEELEPYRAVARDVSQTLGLQPVLRDPAVGRGLDPITACARQVASADLMLAIVGWRRGATPLPELGGDGLRPWAFWEIRSALDRGQPMAVLMAAESWRPELRESDPEIHAMMRDFRGKLSRLAVTFEDEWGENDDSWPLGNFRELVRQQLIEARRGGRRHVAAGHGASQTLLAGTKLRRWPTPRLPARPYPVLLPYTHPDLFAGRERELGALRRQLQLPVPIVGLYALSGTGKSSLLSAGLVPGMRAEGRAVAYDRHPCEPGLAGRLMGDLLASDEHVDDEDPHGFIDLLLAIRRLAGDPPVLVLDQFEELLRYPRGGLVRSTTSAADDKEMLRARAVVGALLAATAQHVPGLDEPPCRWLLAYRQEYHGKVFMWLKDVLRDARQQAMAAVATLPHDLSGSDRFHGWPLQPLGTPAPGSVNRTADAVRIFQAAITAPLDLRTEGGRPCFAWRFAEGGAQRLARAFAEARTARPGVPLAPELQVVLAHLLEQAGEPHGDRTVVVDVPEEPRELIDQALENHLRRALEAAFPSGGPTRRSKEAQLGRTRALLALRELADAQGRRDDGLPGEELARAIGFGGSGFDGHEVLEKLATPTTRLVVLEEQADGWRYVLSHDRMAEVLVRLVDEGHYAGFGVDAELLGLRRFVSLQSELFAAGDERHATEIPTPHFRRLEEHAPALIWGEDQQRWWSACAHHRRQRRRRTRLHRGIAAWLVGAVAWAAWSLADRWAKTQALYDQIASAEPDAAFAAFDQLATDPGAEIEEMLRRLAQREKPLDVLERGVGGVSEPRRAEAVLVVAENVLPILESVPEDPALIASLLWALDSFVAREPALEQRASALREKVLAPSRRRRPPPPVICPKDPDWADVPAGTFQMGTHPGAGRDEPDKKDERPAHKVKISAFRMMTHEVTNAQYRRLVPAHEGEAQLPATGMTWSEAYTYAAWLGGRLPTEAEWEYAARAGCDHAHCRRDGSPASVGEVAWWVGNATDRETLEQSLQPVMRREPNPWGLFDMYGNVSEMNADWYGDYLPGPQVDPVGPTTASTYRVRRGGSVWEPSDWMAAAHRTGIMTGLRGRRTGFRVVSSPCP